MVESKGSFFSPPKDARPMVRWWWPGVDVKRDELLKEIAELDEKGFSGAEIQVITSFIPADLHNRKEKRYDKLHRFMRPYYYEMISAVLDEAEKRHLTIDLSVSSGWPAGGTFVKNEESLQTLVCAQKKIKGNKRYHGPVPGFKKSTFNSNGGFFKLFQADNNDNQPGDLKLRHVVAASAGAETGINIFKSGVAKLAFESLTDLTQKVDEKGMLQWDVPRGSWFLFAFYSGKSTLKPLFSAKEEQNKESLVIDHLSPEPVQKILNLHLGRGTAYYGDHFGRSLRAFFAGNLYLLADMLWTTDFIREFRERRGYDLTVFLPMLFAPSGSGKHACIPAKTAPGFDTDTEEIGERVKYDYHLTVSDLFNDYFVRTMAKWGRKKRLKLRLQPYGLDVDILKAYGISAIPETEQSYAGGITDFLKLAGSAGIIYEKPIVAGEVMGWRMRDYKTTPMKWKVSADRMFVAGINQLVCHGFPYREGGQEPPEAYTYSNPQLPEHLCFSTNFSRVNEFWDYFYEINMYVTRCQYILQQGDTVCNVGVYYPAFNYSDAVLKQEELTGGYLDEKDAPPEDPVLKEDAQKSLTDRERWLKSQIALGDTLTANGYYYTHINEECILDSWVEAGKLIAGSAELEVLIFNDVRYITIALAKKLKQISEEGVRIIFMGRLPERQPGYHNYKANDTGIRELIMELNEEDKAFISGENPVPFLKVKGILPDIYYENEESGIQFIHKKRGGSDYYFIRSNERGGGRKKISFPQGYRTPFILDLWTGAVSEATVYETDGDYINMELDFDPYGSFLIEFKNVNAVKRHVASSNLKVVREDNQIISYSDTQGEFNFKLDSGEWRTVSISDALPDPLELNRWAFELEYKDIKKETRTIRLNMNELKDWRFIPELKFSSGRGRYLTTFTLEESWLSEKIKLLLSLGQVGDVAIIRCNDTELKPLLMPPYETDITPYVKRGENVLEVAVVTTSINRLAGYGRRSISAYRNYKDIKSLMPSGLMGPVRLIPVRRLLVPS